MYNDQILSVGKSIEQIIQGLFFFLNIYKGHFFKGPNYSVFEKIKNTAGFFKQQKDFLRQLGKTEPQTGY